MTRSSPGEPGFPENTYGSPDDAIRQILWSGDVYDVLLHRPLLRAAQEIGRGLPISSSLRLNILDEVMELWLQQPYWQIRLDINDIFRGSGDSVFVAEVTKRLLDPSINDYEKAETAILAAELGRKEEAAAILLDVSRLEIAYPGDDDRNLEAAVALSRIGDKSVAAARLLEIANDPDYDLAGGTSALEALIAMDITGPHITEACSSWRTSRPTAVHALVQLKHF